ncbi:MAG: restriction endonuclease [Chloroflexi bacterium]|nr:restriction endonuclease [Chloroflexota bacterium]
MALPSVENRRFWLVLLYEASKAAGGKLHPADAYSQLVQYFPEITPADLALKLPSGENQWQNRVQWVRERVTSRGFMTRGSPGVWTITDAGRQWLTTHWCGPDADYSQVSRPPKVAAAPPGNVRPQGSLPPQQQAQPPVVRTPAASPGAPPLVALSDPVQQLCHQLTQAQRASQHPDQFEAVLGEAFRFLGFEAKQLGGRGDTDLLLTAPIGPDGYQAIVEAKTSSSGRLSQGHINWPALQQHRQAHQADHAMVVAEDFSDGNVRRFALQFNPSGPGASTTAANWATAAQ